MNITIACRERYCVKLSLGMRIKLRSSCDGRSTAGSLSVVSLVRLDGLLRHGSWAAIVTADDDLLAARVVA